jgi:hypothetical protein
MIEEACRKNRQVSSTPDVTKNEPMCSVLKGFTPVIVNFSLMLASANRWKRFKRIGRQKLYL